MTSAVATARGSPIEPFPLRLADVAAFRRVERALRSAAFHEDTICRALRIESMADFGAVRRAELDLKTGVAGLLALLMRLFLFVEPVSRDEVTQTMDGATLDALLALDLLRPRATATVGEEYYSPVLLYPV